MIGPDLPTQADHPDRPPGYTCPFSSEHIPRMWHETVWCTHRVHETPIKLSRSVPLVDDPPTGRFTIDRPMYPVCACGCGEAVGLGARWRPGHNARMPADAPWPANAPAVGNRAVILPRNDTPPIRRLDSQEGCVGKGYDRNWRYMVCTRPLHMDGELHYDHIDRKWWRGE